MYAKVGDKQNKQQGPSKPTKDSAITRMTFATG